MSIRTLFFAAISFFLFASCNLLQSKSEIEDYKFGLKFASPVQLRAIPYAALPLSGQKLPASVNLSDKMPPPGNQGNQNSCVGWSVAYALKSYQEKVEMNETLVFSPSFIYNQLNNGQDGGILITDAMNLISQKGAALMSDMPYNEKDFTTKPSKEILEKADKYKIDVWNQVNVLDIKEVKAHVNAGYPVIIGVTVDEGFITEGKKKKADYIWKAVVGKKLGPHAMVVVGYDDSKNAVKVMNSWSQQWGDNGFGWIDYDFFPSVVREGYVAKDGLNSGADDSQVLRIEDKKPVKNEPKSDTIAENTVIQDSRPKEIQGIKFDNIRVLHNQNDPKGIDGLGMTITGHADIPAGYGKNFQIAIYINNDGGTSPILSLIPDRYGDPSGNAATATELFSIPPAGLLNYHFSVFMPYAALDIPVGYYVGGRYQNVTTNMWARPFLYIDNYAVGEGEQHKFFVTR